MSKRLTSDDKTGDHPLLGIGHSRHPPEGTSSGLPKEIAVWWTTPQQHPDTFSRNLTRESYPMVSLLSSKIGNPEGFAPIPSSGEFPLWRTAAQEVIPRSGLSHFLSSLSLYPSLSLSLSQIGQDFFSSDWIPSIPFIVSFLSLSPHTTSKYTYFYLIANAVSFILNACT